MKPLTEALDVFQNKEKMSAGCVLPVLTILKEKIAEFKEDRNIIYCTPLVNCLLDGIEKSIEGEDTATASLSETASQPRKNSRFLNGLKWKASAELGEVDRYVNDGYGILEDLNRYQTIKQIFIQYKSALPSSAACERLFIVASLIFVPKRTNLSDANFDRLVFLKQNGTCSRNWKTSPSKTK
ncbi:uncharacterized protein LOC123467617 [Daphnia magna]|uniref:uncharacterized protein LOC123467617 n=1 Tax=Daphnia magna TaxID=35525 RepID=UPI001E1BBF7E|nr:uncharacterized protein LOC123467617 [Daphnia magna]